MPHYTAAIDVARPVPELFAFFSKPSNLLRLAPAEMNLELLVGPDILKLGARLVWKGRRWGMSQQIIQEVATYDHDLVIALEQKQGPFARWLHVHHFEPIEAGTRVVEKIDFDPPTGMLGWLVTADSIRKDLDKLLAHRRKILRELFPPNSDDPSVRGG